MKRAAIVVVLAIALSGCARRVAAPAAAAPSLTAPYLDLQPASRLRVLVPILRGGGYVAHLVESTEQGQTITMTLGSDFIGYETQYYDVLPQGRRVRIAIESASMTKDGVSVVETKPSVTSVRFSPRIAYWRLLYLKRASEVEHDMAVLAAANPALLARMTEAVQSNPQACIEARRSYCSWVPLGVAVRAEKDTAPDGSVPDWVPVL